MSQTTESHRGKNIINGFLKAVKEREDDRAKRRIKYKSINNQTAVHKKCILDIQETIKPALEKIEAEEKKIETLNDKFLALSKFEFEVIKDIGIFTFTCCDKIDPVVIDVKDILTFDTPLGHPRYKFELVLYKKEIRPRFICLDDKEKYCERRGLYFVRKVKEVEFCDCEEKTVKFYNEYDFECKVPNAVAEVLDSEHKIHEFNITYKPEDCVIPHDLYYIRFTYSLAAM